MQTFFITSPRVNSERWLAAFPDAKVITGSEIPEIELNVNSVVWVLLQDEWGACVSHALASGAKVIAMTLVEDVRQAQELISLGANGYIHAFADPKLLRQVQEVVSSGGAWLGASLLQQLVLSIKGSSLKSDQDIGILTKRERDVADCVALGQSNKEISSFLDITERTVKAHLSACFKKLNIRDRMALALILNQ